MRNYKIKRLLLDGLLLACLALMSWVAIAPDVVISMPTSQQMILLTVIVVLVAVFLVVFWREHPSDEREAKNQASASRMAYFVGAIVLVGALFIQSLQHDVDGAIPVALFAMIATKVLSQRYQDD